MLGQVISGGFSFYPLSAFVTGLLGRENYIGLFKSKKVKTSLLVKACDFLHDVSATIN